MEPRVERYQFRLEVRGQIAKCGGRVVVDDDGMCRLQVWMFSPEQSSILLEVTDCDSVEQLWPLFRKVCDHRGVRAIDCRRSEPHLEPWGPVPHGAGHSSDDSAS